MPQLLLKQLEVYQCTLLPTTQGPPTPQKMLKCVAAAVACPQGEHFPNAGRLCGPFMAVQLFWGSRHRAPALLHWSSGALLSGVANSRKAHVLNVFGRFHHQMVSLKSTSRTRRSSTQLGPVQLCQSSPLLVVLHILPGSEGSDRTALSSPCIKLLLVLGPKTATAQVRRQVLLRPDWIELARAEGQGLQRSKGKRLSPWSLMSQGRQEAVGGSDVFCVNGWKMHPVMSVQFHEHYCEKCCVGRSQVARKLASGHAGEVLQLNEEEPWGCTLSKENVSCISQIRRLLSCEKMRSLEIGSVDWLTMREHMWKALVYAREGSGDGFLQGLHKQLDKIAFEAEHGDFTLNMGYWISKFRMLLAHHLLAPEEVPGCLIGHVTLQLFMVFFVDSRGHGMFRKDVEESSLANHSLDVAPICFSDKVDPPLWSRPNVLSTRLSLFKAVRWMFLLESGWPVFKIVSLVTHAACVLRSREKHGCSPRCTQAGYTSEATTRKAFQGCDLSGSSESTHAYGGAGGGPCN
eukprot:symbB.v1.2.028414.t1/scaffold2968.1/size66330/4